MIDEAGSSQDILTSSSLELSLCCISLVSRDRGI